MTHAAHWQVQEVKQRLSEVLRAVAKDGPQTITRHGEEVAVVIDIEDYRRLTDRNTSSRDVLLDPPYFDDGVITLLEEIEKDRKKEFPGEPDLGIES